MKQLQVSKSLLPQKTSQLKPFELSVFMAAQGKTVGNCSTPELKKAITISVEKGLINLNQGKDLKDDDVLMLVEAVREYLCEKHLFLTLDELSASVRMGSMGEFKKDGETLYMSAEKIAGWVRSYLEQKKRPVMAKIASMKKDEEKPIDTKAVLSDPDVQKWRKEIMDNVGKIGSKHKATQLEMKGIKESEEERELRALCKTISKSEITGLLKEYQPGTWTYQILSEELERKKIAELPPPGFPII